MLSTWGDSLHWKVADLCTFEYINVKKSHCHLHPKSSLQTTKQLWYLHNFGNNSHALPGLLELRTLYEVCLSFWRDHDIFFLGISKVTLFTSRKSGVQPPTLISYLTTSSSLFPFAYTNGVQLTQCSSCLVSSCTYEPLCQFLLLGNFVFHIPPWCSWSLVLHRV